MPISSSWRKGEQGVAAFEAWCTSWDRHPKGSSVPADFKFRYEQAYGEPPGYVAAQAAAAGFLSAEAHRREYNHDQVRQWRTTTLLGSFALDKSWRQVGHTPITIQWRNGRQVRAT